MNSDRLDQFDGRISSDLFLPPAGWRVLVPGLPHWYWQQNDQAIVFFLFHLATMALGLFSWGTWLSLLMLGFAFAAHAFSAADAIKQAAFPKFGPLVPMVAASLGLGTLCYVPIMVLGSMFAWPVVAEHRPREAYWVNRWAYRGASSPQHGEMIWLSPTQGLRPRLARVVAGEGQKVWWSQDRLHLAEESALESLVDLGGPTHALELTVPARHVLVSFQHRFVEPFVDSLGWEIIAHDEVHGRAWAQSYPVWDRRLLR